jgi:hypothetical protein
VDLIRQDAKIRAIARSSRRPRGHRPKADFSDPRRVEDRNERDIFSRIFNMR